MKAKVLLLLFLFSAHLYSDTRQIKGIVIDSKTQEEIIGATILVKEYASLGTITGLDGSFTVNNLKALPVTINCSYVGYKTAELKLEEETNNAKVTIFLEPSAEMLDELVVYAANTGNSDNGARTIEKNSMNVVNIVSARAIEMSPDMTVANVIQRVSGVTVERNNSGDGQYAILRGMDKRYNYTLVNGIKIPSPDNKNRFVPLDMFSAEMLERLDVSKALTADMEGDGIGGAVNMVMKDAPSERQFTVNLSTGYNGLFLTRDFLTFDTKGIDKQSPYELYGEKYAAKARDFSGSTIDLKSKNAGPNIFAGFSYGDRLFNNRFGFILAGSYQNSYRGSDSKYYDSSTATSDASNLPVLKNKKERTYSDRQTRYGVHGKFDLIISKSHKLQWYNAYMVLENAQVRDTRTTDLNIGYDPANGDYNLSFDTRFRYIHQDIFNTTLKGTHAFSNNRLQADWSAVYSKAYNEVPDNSTVYTVTTVRSNVQNPTSVTTLGGTDRRWEHNSDKDIAGYLNLKYNINIQNLALELSTGGMYRNKKRMNFFNQYDFRPYDETKPEGSKNNLIQGVDWEKYSDIKFMVYNPYGAVGNPLNYDATEDISAAYIQSIWNYRKLQIVAGVRVEHTSQGYDLKHAIENVQNKGEQEYTDLLPSVHLKYALNEKTNLRSSYYKSINRPGFFEIVPYRIINEDFVERGNPDLRHTIAHSFDLRYEYFPRSSEQIMFGLFYKNIKDPIEFGMISEGQGTFYMPSNFGDAANYGLELDVTKYFHRIGFKANYTLTLSEITTTKLQYVENPDTESSEKLLLENVDQKRSLNGQSMHVANLSLLYKDTKNGWDAQLAASYTGDKLYAISRYKDNDIWQSGYLQMDASVEKKFKIGLTIFLKANNLLNTPMRQFIKKQNNANLNVEGYKNFGKHTLVREDYYNRTIQVGLKYKL